MSKWNFPAPGHMEAAETISYQMGYRPEDHGHL